MKIKTTYTKIALAIALTVGISSAAMADGNAFTPLNFDDTTYVAPAKAPKTTNPVSQAVSKIMPKTDSTKDAPSMLNSISGQNPIGNDNIQNAILELDNAQVGIRNELLEYKSKYSDVDAQYKLIKNERSMLHKQVVSTEKRIKNIDKAKDRIRKNML